MRMHQSHTARDTTDTRAFHQCIPHASGWHRNSNQGPRLEARGAASCCTPWPMKRRFVALLALHAAQPTIRNVHMAAMPP